MESGSRGLKEALKPYNQQLADAVYGTRRSPVAVDATLTPDQIIANLRGENKLPFKTRMGPLTSAENRQTLMLTRAITWMLQNNNITSSEPAHNQPPYWSDPVELSSRFSLAAAASPVFTNILEFQVPKGRRMSLKGIGVNVDDATYNYNGDILFRLSIDGRAVNTYEGYGEQRGSIVQPRRMPDVIIQFPQKLIFSIRRVVAAGSAQNVEMAFQGYIWRLINTYEGSKGARPYA